MSFLRHRHVALVLFIALQPSARTQERPAQAPAAADSVRVDDSPDRRRFLSLADGRVLQLRSRLLEGRWQRRNGPDWVDLAGEVVKARLETEVLAEFRQRKSAVGSKDHAARVELAGWMVSEGLYERAIGQLDRVLRAWPDHPMVLAFVARNPIPLEQVEAEFGQAAQLRALLLAGARGSQATREVAIERLSEMGAFVDLRQVLKAEMAVMQDRRREFASHAARRLFPGELVRELSSRTLLDKQDSVRVEAAKALRDTRDVAVIAPAINAMSSKSPSIRSNAAEALGNMGYKAGVEPLVHRLAALQTGGGTIGHRANIYIGFQTAYVQDYDLEIAQGASIADPIINVQDSGVVLDARATVQMTIEVEMRKVMTSLRQLTGQKIADVPGKWAAWWEQNQGQWRSLDHARTTARAPAQDPPR
jgi:hypothetical protein